jgi:outer membrane protein with beta-barrel domain
MAGGVVILCSSAAWAQGNPPPIVRADAAGSLGWFNAKESIGPDDDDWYSRSALGSAFGGWYWTDHLKTEIEAGGSTRASLYGYTTRFENNQPVFTSTRAEYSTRRVAVSQHYQFFRNTWFHPFVGGGVDLIWTTSESEQLTSYPYVSGPGSPRLPDERHVHPESTDFDVHPFALVGYKAYFNQWVFFRNDLRLTLDGGVNEVAIRFGIGVDVVAGRRQ